MIYLPSSWQWALVPIKHIETDALNTHTYIPSSVTVIWLSLHSCGMLKQALSWWVSVLIISNRYRPQLHRSFLPLHTGFPRVIQRFESEESQLTDWDRDSQYLSTATYRFHPCSLSPPPILLLYTSHMQCRLFVLFYLFFRFPHCMCCIKFIVLKAWGNRKVVGREEVDGAFCPTWYGMSGYLSHSSGVH